MIPVPSHIRALQPYKPGKSSDPSAYSRYKAILSSNENNYGPSPLAMEAITEFINTVHLYPDPQGEILIDHLSSLHSCPQSHVTLSNGLDGLLYSMFKAFTVEGDHVITNENSFIAFNKFAQMHHLSLTRVENVDYQFHLQGIINSIQSNTRIIYICNPNNPTGGMIPKMYLQQLLDEIPRDILVVVDEAYFNYAESIDHNFPDSSKMGFDHVLTLRTFSKLYGLAGLRIGYGVGPEHIIQALNKVKLVFNPNTLAQVAAAAALNDNEHVLKTLSNNKLWISKVQNQLLAKEIRYIKSYANFVCTIFKKDEEALNFMNFMDSHGVLLRKLDSFGMPEGVRISIGNDEEMQYFSKVLERFK